MSETRLVQLGAAGGVLFVVLQMAGQALIQVGGVEPAFAAPAPEIVTFFARRNPALFMTGGYLSTLSAIPFFWFLGALWGALRQHEGAPGWLSLVAFGSGLAALAVVLTANGWGLAIFRVEEGLSPELARTLFDQGNMAFATYWVCLASLLLAAGLAALQGDARRRPLPRWLAWLGLATAVALLVARFFWATSSGLIFVPYMLFWIWLIAASISLLRRARQAAGAAAVAPTGATAN